MQENIAPKVVHTEQLTTNNTYGSNCTSKWDRKAFSRTHVKATGPAAMDRMENRQNFG
jgi:hypothetical protein